MIKLFVSDIDGTLLNEKHLLSKKNEDAIHRLIETGVEFMLASGRHYEAAMMPVQHMGHEISCIALNGGDVRNEKGISLFTKRISDEAIDKIHNIIQELNVTMEYYCEDFAYTQVPIDIIEDVYIESYARMFHMSPEESVKVIKDLDIKTLMTYEKNFSEIKNHHILKIEFHFKEEEEKALAISKLQDIEGVQLASSAHLNLEITHQDANKANMIKEVCARRGYGFDEVIVIGDSDNDISMLLSFPHSYAMGNADPVVKQSATYIAPSNVEDGVAQIIEKIINENKKKV